MLDSIVDIFRRALEKHGANLTQNQVSVILREVEDCGVPIDWNSWYHHTRTRQPVTGFCTNVGRPIEL